MNNTVIVKSGLLLIKERNLLVARSNGKNRFYIPGGKIEKSETFKEALSREIQEELSVSVIESSILEYGVFTTEADGKKNTNVSLHTYFAEVTGTPQPSSEIEEIKWINSNNINELSEASALVLNSLLSDDLVD